jgi:hypothetical protein
MGFFLGYRFLCKSIGPSLWLSLVHYTSYDTKMLLKVIFDITVFAKLKISNNFKHSMRHIQNNQNSIGISILAYGFYKFQ